MSMQVTGPFDEELITHLPSSVKFICHNGAGYDQIDVNACIQNGGFSPTDTVTLRDCGLIQIFSFRHCGVQYTVSRQ